MNGAANYNLSSCGTNLSVPIRPPQNLPLSAKKKKKTDLFAQEEESCTHKQQTCIVLN